MFFFFNDTATTEIYTLSLHDALPIFVTGVGDFSPHTLAADPLLDVTGAICFLELEGYAGARDDAADRKSTRLNSSHANISYAVFCLKKKKIHPPFTTPYNIHYSHALS